MPVEDDILKKSRSVIAAASASRESQATSAAESAINRNGEWAFLRTTFWYRETVV